MNTIFEQTGGRYVQYGDYLFPDLALPDEEHWTIGKYGRMRQAYLKEHHPGQPPDPVRETERALGRS